MLGNIRGIPVTIWLLLITSAIFVVQIFNTAVELLFILWPPVLLFEPWRLISAAFLHANFTHIFYNMFGLLFFGLALESIIGSKRFLGLYFAAAFVGNIAGAIAYPDVPSLGASGAVMGIIGMLAAIRPLMMVFVGFGVPMPVILAAGLWAFFDFVGLISPVQTGIGNAAHLAGLGLGVAVGLALRKQFKRPRRHRKTGMMEDSEFYG